MIEIVHRYTRAVIYRSEADAIGAAAKEALASRAVLMGAVLTDADLTGADLTDADLTDADLRDADLTGADLSKSNGGTALGDFLRITGTRHPIIAIDEENVSIGCMRNSLAWWSEHYADTGQSQGYSAKQIEEYRLHIEYVATWMSARKQAVRS